MVHLHLGISNCEFTVWFCLIFGVLNGWIGKELLHGKLWMKFISHYILHYAIYMCVLYYRGI